MEHTERTQTLHARVDSVVGKGRPPSGRYAAQVNARGSADGPVILEFDVKEPPEAPAVGTVLTITVTWRDRTS